MKRELEMENYSNEMAIISMKKSIEAMGIDNISRIELESTCLDSYEIVTFVDMIKKAGVDIASTVVYMARGSSNHIILRSNTKLEDMKISTTNIRDCDFTVCQNGDIQIMETNDTITKKEILSSKYGNTLYASILEIPKKYSYFLVDRDTKDIIEEISDTVSEFDENPLEVIIGMHTELRAIGAMALLNMGYSDVELGEPDVKVIIRPRMDDIETIAINCNNIDISKMQDFEFKVFKNKWIEVKNINRDKNLFISKIKIDCILGEGAFARAVYKIQGINIDTDDNKEVEAIKVKENEMTEENGIIIDKIVAEIEKYGIENLQGITIETANVDGRTLVTLINMIKKAEVKLRNVSIEIYDSTRDVIKLDFLNSEVYVIVNSKNMHPNDIEVCKNEDVKILHSGEILTKAEIISNQNGAELCAIIYEDPERTYKEEYDRKVEENLVSEEKIKEQQVLIDKLTEEKEMENLSNLNENVVIEVKNKKMESDELNTNKNIIAQKAVAKIGDKLKTGISKITLTKAFMKVLVTDKTLNFSAKGIAVQKDDGDYRAYVDKSIVNINKEMVIENMDVFVKIPTKKSELRISDMIEQDGKYYFISEKNETGVVAVNVSEGKAEILLPTTNVLGYSTYTKVISCVQMMGGYKLMAKTNTGVLAVITGLWKNRTNVEQYVEDNISDLLTPILVSESNSRANIFKNKFVKKNKVLIVGVLGVLGVVAVNTNMGELKDTIVSKAKTIKITKKQATIVTAIVATLIGVYIATNKPLRTRIRTAVAKAKVKNTILKAKEKALSFISPLFKRKIKEEKVVVEIKKD